MNETALTTSTGMNGEKNPLALLPTGTLEDFQQQVFAAEPNRLTMASLKAGTTDTLMHAGAQLSSENVANHVLTIIRVAYAVVPATDANGKPIYDEYGAQKKARYPVCHFREAPGYWYNGGAMLQKNIEAWCAEVGDDMTDPNLPTLNTVLDELGGVRAYFVWKNKKDGGQKYMNIILG